MGKINIFMILLLLCSISLVIADSIGKRQDAQINTPYIISQPCATCSYINISVFTKNGVVFDNVAMENNGSTWTYTFTPNESLRYDVNGKGDINGLNDSFAFWFDATLSGEQTNPSIIISDIVLLLGFIGILLMLVSKHEKTDFDGWNKRIIDNHKNMGETFVKGFIYKLFKNSFVWCYFIGWFIIFIIKDIVFRFNSAEIYGYFTLIANIYSLGMILVIVYMIGNFATYIKESISVLTDRNWGVGE